MEKKSEKPKLIIFQNSKDEVLNDLINSLNETNNKIKDYYYKNTFNIEEKNNINKEKDLFNEKIINLEFSKIFSLPENLTFDENELLNNINKTSDLHINTINKLIAQLDFNIVIEEEDETIKTIYNSNTFEDDFDEENLNECDENILEMRVNKYQFKENSNNQLFIDSDYNRLSEFRQDSKTKFDLIEREFKTNFIIHKNFFNRPVKKRNFTLPNLKIDNKKQLLSEIKNENNKKNCIIF